MGRILSAFRAGLSGKSFPDGDTFVVAGRPVSCRHCGHDHFVEGEAQLHTAGLTFFNLEWASPTAHTLSCTKCGLIEWFLSDPETTEESRSR